ncbi:MAG: hypothetical protein ACHQRJ_14470 [Alphaproteobacteria bacterium]
MALDWFDVGKVALTSGVLASGINLIWQHFSRRESYRRDARYLAQRLAVILEKFAIDCADIIAGNELHRTSDGHAGVRRLALPTLAAFPADADWKAVDSALAGRAVALPNEIALADHKILFWWDVVGDEDCMETEADQQAGMCGYRAWNLAADLRMRHGVPASDLTDRAWDFVATLQKQHEAAMKSLEARAQPRAPDSSTDFDEIN